MGTVKFGRNTDVKYPSAFNIPTDAAIADLLALAQDLGINLLDTAPAYGLSEERLGKLLRGQRDKWIIVDKAGEDYVEQASVYNFSKQHILQSIKISLQKLRTDYIDLLLIHSDGNDEHVINNFDVFHTLAEAKQQGLIRYYGMSTKTVSGGIATLHNADVAMVQYNPFATDELPVIQEAARLQKGVLIKKAFASGHLDQFQTSNPVQAAMDFIYAQPGVGSIILGTIDPQHLVENVACACAALEKSDA